MPQADSGVFVPVIPSFKGFGAALGKGVTQPAAQAGTKAGTSFSKSFSVGAKSAGDLTELRKKLGDSVRKVALEVKRARGAEEDATRKVVIEETKLQELRDSGKAKASQLLAAEDRLAKAQRTQATAQGKLVESTQKLEDAQFKAKRELQGAEDASKSAGKQYQTLGGRIKAAVTGSGKGAFRGIANTAAREGASAGRRFGGGFGKSFKAGLGVVAGALVLLKGATELVSFGKGAYDEARSSQKVGAVTEQIIVATGKAAKVSAADVGDLATAISNKTGVDDEAIQSGANLLLTFKNVRNEAGQGANIFDRANQAAVDLSKAGFGSIEGGAKMLGKALNDPVKGISALSRAGVTFTAQQQKQIKTLTASGDVLGAQKIILKEVEGQVGGVAAKSATAGEKLATTFGNFKEAIGTAFLPYIDKAQNSALRFFGWLDSNKDTIGQVFGSGVKILGTFGRIAIGTFKALTSGLGDGQASFESFADFLSENQAGIIDGFVKAGKGVLLFGRTLATSSSVGLRAFAFLLDGITTGTQLVLTAIGGIAGGAAAAFGWIPGLGPKLKQANASFASFSRTAVDGSRKAAAGARGLADGIDNKIIPAIDRGVTGLDKLGKTEVMKARQRDAAAKAARLIGEIGTKSDGSQVKLRRFANITRLSATEQMSLRKRLKDASVGLRDQVTSMRQAGAGQDKLTKAWEKGRDRLYKEFRQMGLSKAEAKKLAKQYAGVKPKVKTEFSTPGLPKAQERAEKFDETIENTKGKKIKISAELKINASAGVTDWNKALTKKYGKSARLIAAATGGGISGPGTGTSDSIPALLSNGEHVWTKKEVDAVGGHRRMIEMRKDVLRRAAGGPVEAKYSTAGFKDAYSPHGAFGRLDDLYASKALAGNNQRAATYFADIGKLMKDSRDRSVAAKKAADAAASSAGAGGRIGTRKVGGGWGPIQSAMRAKGARSFNTYAGHHPSPARARDVTPHNWAAANAARALSSVWYVIYRMKIASKSAGKGNTWRTYHPNNRRGDWRHEHHIHVARYAKGGQVGPAQGGLVKGGQFGELAKRGMHAGIYDSGGTLQPGLTLAFNGTGKPERIQTHEQARRSDKAGAAPQRTFIAQGPDAKAVYRELKLDEAAHDALHPIW